MDANRTTATAGASGLVLGALLGAAAMHRPEPVPEPPVGSVRIEAPSIVAKMQQANARPELTCVMGAVSNEPEKIFCTDGGTAGFFLTEAEGVELANREHVTLVGDDLFAR
jgi:hypothetical protein